MAMDGEGEEEYGISSFTYSTESKLVVDSTKDSLAGNKSRLVGNNAKDMGIE